MNETPKKNKTSKPPKSDLKMDAYIVMLHLVSQGWTNFTEINKLFSWSHFKMGHTYRIVGHINRTIKRLRKEWNEDIPIFNAFIFSREKYCTSYIIKNVFGKEDGEQPSPKEIAEYAAAIAAYDKWDKVIEVLRQEAF